MSSIGAYATARRGQVSWDEIDNARRALGSRATPSQIAKYLGRCVTDVGAMINPPSSQSQAPGEP